MERASQAETEIWRPSGTEIVGVNRRANALIGVLGRSGSGKSHLVRQLLLDPQFGPSQVLVLMAEDSTATYGVNGVHVRQVSNLDSLRRVVDEIVNRPAGTQLPRVIVWDSVSGTLDYQRRHYAANPILTRGDERDKRAEFGEMGYMGMDQMITLRDSVDSDVIALCTTYEGGVGVLPEFAIEGRLLPKNFVRLTNVCLHLKAESNQYPKGAQVTPHPWRVVSKEGVYIDRFFYTSDSGEIQAKGHHALDLKEPAFMPDVLRKIHSPNTMEEK